MKTFGQEDQRHIEVAIAWLKLSKKNHQEASEELWQINPRFRKHPRFLHIWWHICSKAGNLDASLEIAKQRLEVDPNDGPSWSDLSWTLHRMGKTQEALDSLWAVKGRFPRYDLIPHNLTCYLCVLGRIEEARVWMRRTLEVAAKEGEEAKRRQRMLDDPELEPLWPDLKALECLPD